MESKMKLNRKALLIIAVAGLCVLATAQNLKTLIKLVGVTVAVERFSGDINKAVNKVANYTDTPAASTKVVPILSVGKGKGAIGAAQVMGPKSRIDQVKAVAQVEADFLGEFRIKVLIPVSTKDVISNIRRVDGVGVSGILDLKL